MTKIYKLDKEMYKLVNEETGSTEVCDKNVLKVKQDAIEKRIAEREEQRLKNIEITFFNVRDAFRQIDNDEFKRYLKSIKSCKEVQIPTGNIIFSEDKYNAKQKSIMDKKAELIKQFNNIANNIKMSVSERAKALMPIRKEIDELNRIVLSKDAKEFQIEEYITVKIKPIDAFEMYLKLNERYDAAKEKAKQDAIDAAIAKETSALKDMDDDDFVFIKRLKKLINPSVFYDMFEYKHYNELKSAIMYDSKEAYLNRPRDVKYETPKLSFTEEEGQSVIYLNKLIGEYFSKREEIKLQEEAKRLQNEADSLMLV